MDATWIFIGSRFTVPIVSIHGQNWFCVCGSVAIYQFWIVGWIVGSIIGQLCLYTKPPYSRIMRQLQSNQSI